MSHPTKQEFRAIARKAVDIFQRNGLTTCLFGGAACEMYGCTRTPNDVDLIVMTTSHTTESLKNILVLGGGGDFYLRPSKKIGATYKILYCKIPSSFSTSHYSRSSKVDILIPGILNIPLLSSTVIVRIDGLPVLPFFALLMLKVQGWSDHRKSDRSDYRLKQHQDVADVNQLLALGQRRGEDLHLSLSQLPLSFQEIGLQVVAEYVNIKGRRAVWENLGFEFV